MSLDADTKTAADSHSTESTAAPPPPTPQERFDAGVGNFGSIATFSLVNTALIHSSAGLIFVGTLGISRIMDCSALAAQEHGYVLIQGLFIGLSILATAFFWGLGRLARSGRRWPFYVGISAYALDAGLCVMIGDWIEVAFHAFLLIGLVDGLRALKQLETVEGPEPATAPEAAVAGVVA
jgi:hypothetical protein